MSEPLRTPAVVSIVGKKKSGKTTTLVRVAAELSARGWHVATIKHSHGFEIDHQGRDSFRHRHEGRAIRTVVASDDAFAVVGAWPEQHALTAAELADRFLCDADIVLVEGYHTERLPTIEVYRAGGQEPWYHTSGTAHYLAIATDAPIVADVPVLDLNDATLAGALADIIESRVMRAVS